MGNNLEQSEQSENNKHRNPAMPIISLNVNCLDIPNKDRDCQTKKLTLNVKTYLS